MAISAISLRCFRGFKEATLDLKPLTVLLGPNSAGKSCFGQAIGALKQVHERGGPQPDIKSTEPGQEDLYPIDLGSYRELTHQGCCGDIEILLKVDGSWIELGYTDPSRFLAPTESFRGISISRIGVSSATKPLETRIFRGSEEPQSVLPVSTGGTPDELAVPEWKDLGPVGSGTSITKMRNDQAVDYRVERKTKEAWHLGGRPVRMVFRGLELLTAVDLASEQPLGLSKAPLVKLAELLEGVRYLQPTRLLPLRWYADTGVTDRVGARGQHLASFLSANQESTLVPFFPLPKPPSSPGEATQQLARPLVWEGETVPLRDATNDWLRYLGLASDLVAKTDRSSHIRMDARVTPGSALRPLTDVGFGVSQVLPVIVAGLSMPRKSGCLIVEQPEAQLHPRPQAALADFFCSLIKCGHRAIVETHSEHFFHRLRLRAAMDDDLADKIGVFFVDAPSGDGICCEPRRVSLTEEGELMWPDGFLTEGLEAESFVRAARIAKHNKAR